MQDQMEELEHINTTLDADRGRFESGKKAEQRKFHNELAKVNKGKDDSIECIRRIDAGKAQRKALDLQIDRMNEEYEDLLRKEKLLDNELQLEYDYKAFMVDLLNTQPAEKKKLVNKASFSYDDEE